MGITARGAWESVKRHFREMGVDRQTTDFSCVGIGDMSGDVFGNGMLLSKHIKLVAAFDHRHVFDRPGSRPGAQLAERARLFALPRSSWADYDTSLISEPAAGSSRGRQVDSDHRADPRGAGPGQDRRGADPGRADQRLPEGAGRPAVERRYRHLREGRGRDQRRRRGQGQRRAAGQRRGRQGQVRGGGRQPRPDPARPDRVRGLRRADQHRLHRQLRRRGHLRLRGEHQDPAHAARWRRAG